MFSLTVYFGPTNATLVLLYKEEEKAKAAYNDYVNASIVPPANNAVLASDDFGQAIALPLSQINGVLFDDMDQSQRAYIERGLHNARAQAKAQQRAGSDPTIRAAAMSQGPAALTPFGNGRMS